MTEPKEHPFINVDEIPCQEISDPAVLSKVPLVSVKMITYNHELYIAQAIEGVLMQETDFPIELVIGEDCSTDRTREIVFEYQKKHPDIIRVIASDKNVGAKRNSLRVENACRGKYIAFCEGDDYWHYPLKLQKQINILETNPEVGMVHADFDTLDQVRGRIINSTYKVAGKIYPQQEDICRLMLKKKYDVATCTVCVRRSLLNEIREKYSSLFAPSFPVGDFQLWFCFAFHSRIVLLEESLATYRIHGETASHSSNIEKKIVYEKGRAELYFLVAEKFSFEETKAEIVRVFYKNILRLSFFSKNPTLAEESMETLKEYKAGINLIDMAYYLGAKNKKLIPIAKCIMFFSKCSNKLSHLIKNM